MFKSRNIRDLGLLQNTRTYGPRGIVKTIEKNFLHRTQVHYFCSGNSNQDKKVMPLPCLNSSNQIPKFDSEIRWFHVLQGSFKGLNSLMGSLRKHRMVQRSCDFLRVLLSCRDLVNSSTEGLDAEILWILYKSYKFLSKKFTNIQISWLLP